MPRTGFEPTILVFELVRPRDRWLARKYVLAESVHIHKSVRYKIIPVPLLFIIYCPFTVKNSFILPSSLQNCMPQVQVKFYCCQLQQVFLK
jgi:hypothetical protein